ncbi:MAG TPA: EamA family transporter [Candidatus Limnocylindria bacterium]|nr:EamA family transporter [Candidatus Limnocylindria bacterium]
MFAGVVLIGGSNFVAVRFSNAELPPFWGAGLRFLPASMLLLAAMTAWRIPFPRGASLRGAAIYGALNFGLGYALAYYGLQDAPAGTGAVVLATVPLFTLVLVALHGLERFRVRGLAGGIIALAGIALVFREQLSASVPLLSLLAILGNALVAAESGVIAKGLPRMHPIATNAVGMFVGALFVLALSFAVGETRALPHTATTWAVIAYLSVIGSIGLFGLFLVMLRRWTASASSYALVVMPLVAVALGALLRGETITPIFLVGGVLVALGVYVGALSGAIIPGSRAVPGPTRSASSR